MVMETKYEDLPDHVVKQAKRDILDTFGVTMAGSASAGVAEIVEFVQEQGGKEESLIPFYGGARVPAMMAGLAIGPMTRAIDLGLCHQEAHHCAEYTFGAMLAALGLKKKVSGKEFITAWVVGQELQIRVGMAIKALSKAAVDNSYGGHFIFGTVASVAKLLDFSLDELENAEGIARGMTQPWDMAMFAPVTLTMRAHHGFLDQDTITACLLAQKGITGPRQDILAGPRGYLYQFSKWDTDPDALTRGLGEEWESASTLMKVHAACACTHASADGIIGQMETHHFKFEDIASIHLDQCSLNYNVVSQPYEKKWHPETEQDCQFSVPYVVATAACDGKVFLDSYSPEVRTRPEVRDLMKRVSVKEDPSLPNLGTKVTTTLKDGTSYSGEYFDLKGYPTNRLTDEELVDKFKSCVPYSACKLSEGTVNSLIERILDLEQREDVESALLLPVMPK
jgi:2-methylcitrate dehydratase PrpD